MQVTPKSESPMRKTRRDGKSTYMGQDGRDKKSAQIHPRHVNTSPFLDGTMGEGDHVGDGAGHDQSEAVSDAVSTKSEMPTSDQSGPEKHVTSLSGGPDREHHEKSWDNKFTHLDPPKHWISGAIKHPGALRKSLGVKKGETIPAKKLSAAAKKGGTLGRRARLAQTLKGMH